jgi:hypothetical protein
VTQMTLFGPGSRGGRAATPPVRPLRAPMRAVWARLVVKSPPPCADCLREQHRTWGDGVTLYTGLKRARQRRTLGGEHEDFCDPHAEVRKAEDKAVAPAAPQRYRVGRPR